MKVIESERGLQISSSLLTLHLVGLVIFGLDLCAFIEWLLHHIPLDLGIVLHVAIFGFLGLFISILAGGIFELRDEFKFDAREKKLIWSRCYLWGSRRGTIPFDQIAFAVVQANIGGNAGIGYRIALVTHDGLIPLTTWFTVSWKVDRRCRDIRSKINKILDIHLTSEDANDILQMVRDGKQREAQAMAKKRYHLKSAQAAEMVEKLGQQAKEQN